MKAYSLVFDAKDQSFRIEASVPLRSYAWGADIVTRGREGPYLEEHRGIQVGDRMFRVSRHALLQKRATDLQLLVGRIEEADGLVDPFAPPAAFVLGPGAKRQTEAVIVLVQVKGYPNANLSTIWEGTFFDLSNLVAQPRLGSYGYVSPDCRSALGIVALSGSIRVHLLPNSGGIGVNVSRRGELEIRS